MNSFNQIIILINILNFIFQSNNPIYYIKSVYCPYYILLSGQYSRMITHAFTHNDIHHLVINMLVFYQMNFNIFFRNLNLKLILFYYFIIFNLLNMGISYFLYHFFSYPHLFMARSVGFSGVLFCLKYLLNLFDGDNIVMLYGINISRKYVVFLELLMISIMVPNVSFSGHLFGILTGVIMNFFNLV